MLDDHHTHGPGVDVQPPPIPFKSAREPEPGGAKRFRARGRGPLRGGRSRRPRRRIRWLRLAGIVAGLGILAVASALFGMMMAIASDLPQLENYRQYRADVHNSYLYDDVGRPIGVLAAPDNVVIDDYAQISPYMRNAIVSVEDKRFWHESGIDVRGVLRAALNDLTGGPREGASTIPEQFVKNALEEQDNRTIFEKLREAVLAFQLAHEWSHAKILREYLDSIYFGNGAYGIESAARVYFGRQLGFTANATASTPASACGSADSADPHLPSCASKLDPAQAALLAGMVANPSAFDPVLHPKAAWGRRELVLADMLAQHYITAGQYRRALDAPLPTAADIQQPQQPSAAPYFTSWVEPQIIAALEHAGVPPKLAAYRAYYGGLKIRTSIDLRMQQAAQQAVDSILPQGPNEPTAAMVVIDNRTGEVRAMVSGNGDYSQRPFNLAVDGLRQPGSAFKLFTLVAALESGRYGPDSIIDSRPLNIPVPRAYGGGRFIVHNAGNTYAGPITLAQATAVSDNTVFSQVGLSVGTRTIAAKAHLLGIRTPISDNYSMILGGLRTGVSALDMAHAYETIATGGLKVYNPILGDVDQGPIGIQSITCPRGCPFHQLVNHPVRRRVVPAAVAATIQSLLRGPVSPGGTAPDAAIPGVMVAGKTGTTNNYVDAWFVGFTPQLTAAVWVGYPQGAIPMTTQYQGGPVYGGTYPAQIWHAFMVSALAILAQEHGARARSASSVPIGSPTVSAPSTPAPTGAATTPAPASSTTGTARGGATTPTPTHPASAGGAQTGAATTPAPAGAPGNSPAAPATTTPAAAPNAGAGEGGGSGGAGLGSGAAGGGG